MRILIHPRSWLIALTVSILTIMGTGCGHFSKPDPGFGRYPILQGVTGVNWTRLNLMRSRSDDVKVRFLNAQGEEVPAALIRQTTHEFAASDKVIDEFQLRNLPLQSHYTMRVEAAGKLRDERRFRLRSPHESMSFALVSCADDRYVREQAKMWDSVAAAKPDFIFAIGDNSYADRENGKAVRMSSPEVLWRRYAETRETLGIFRQADLIPLIAVWDDHDYGANNGDRRYPHRHESLQIFRAFFPQGDSFENFNLGPGVASRFTFGEQQFLFLDNRSFRSPGKTSPACLQKKDSPLCQPRPDEMGPDELAKKEPETHFGHEQTEWALKSLRQAGTDVTWLISGDQWFGAYSPFESFQGSHPKDFAAFIKELRRLPHSRYAFLSGDRHSSEITRVDKSLLGFESLEIVSSPVHAKVYPSNWTEFPNPQQVAGIAGAFNYVFVDSEVLPHQWKIKMRNFHWDAGRSEVVPGFEVESLIPRPIAE